MAYTILGQKTSGKGAPGDPTLVGGSDWDSTWILAGGAKGDVLVYDPTQTSRLNGVAAVAVGQVFASTGVATLPVWTATPTVTSMRIGQGDANDGVIKRVGVGQLALRNVADTDYVDMFFGTIAVKAAVMVNIVAAQLFASGWSAVGGASAHDGEIRIGDAAANQLRLSYYNATGNVYIDSTFDNATGTIFFRNRVAGTPVNSLALTATSATFAGFQDIPNISAPAAPGANVGRLYVDTSGGKNRLVVVFSSGAPQVIATQP